MEIEIKQRPDDTVIKEKESQEQESGSNSGNSLDLIIFFRLTFALFVLLCFFNPEH